MERPPERGEGRVTQRPLRIWIDLENSPHVLFFEPVIAALRRRGHDVIVTGRRFCNTLPLSRARNIPVRVIGNGYDTGRTHVIKRCFHVVRRKQLQRFARRQRFDVAASHGSRTQTSAAAALGIPAWVAIDYEHAYLRDLRRAECLMTPSIMPADAFDHAGIPRAVIRHYDGLKEDVYLHGFRPVTDMRRRLGLIDDERLVVFRPASDNAHYGSDAGRIIEERLLSRLAQQERVRIVVLPRTEHQRRRLRAFETADGKVHLPAAVLDGPSLIHSADLVVSGGGTMAREAAVLGVPAISSFTGRLGAVDTFLVREGRMRLVRRVDDVDALGRVRRHGAPVSQSSALPLQQIVDSICDTGRREFPRTSEPAAQLASGNCSSHTLPKNASPKGVNPIPLNGVDANSLKT